MPWRCESGGWGATVSYTINRFMNRIWVVICLLIMLSLTAKAQYRTLVSEDFSNGITGLDLSRLVYWGGQRSVVSAFQVQPKSDRNGVQLNAATMTPMGMVHFDWHFDTTLRMMNSIDYSFPPVNRQLDTVRAMVHVLWDTVRGSGESGRINLMFYHDYPNGGPQFGYSDSIRKANAFGRPAYHARIVPRTVSGTYNGYLSYGGGDDSLGQFYQFGTSTKFWTPGAVPGPSGPSRGNYPSGPALQLNTSIARSREWRTYTLTLLTERLALAWRVYGQPESSNSTVLTMALPKTSADTLQTLARFQQLGLNINRLPQKYYWFPQVSGFRLYGVGAFATYWGGVQIEATQHSPITKTKTSLAAAHPAFRIIQDQLHSEQPIRSLRIYDALGRVVFQPQLTTSQQVIDLPQHVSGLYLMEFNGALYRLYLP